MVGIEGWADGECDGLMAQPSPEHHRKQEADAPPLHQATSMNHVAHPQLREEGGATEEGDQASERLTGAREEAARPTGHRRL